MDERKLYRKARRRVREKKSFYTNLTSYVAVMAFLIALNLLTSPTHWWFIYPMLGWGLGLAMHYFKVFGWPGVAFQSPEWEQREIERELARMGRPARRRHPSLSPPDEKADLLDELDRRLEAHKVVHKPYDDSDLV